MRICLLSARFPPQRCGVGDYTYFLADELGRMGYDVDVITTRGELDESLYPLGPRVHLHRVVGNWGVSGLGEIIGTIRRVRPDVLVVQYTPHSFDRRGITLAINLLPSLVRLLVGVRVVTNFHELFLPFSNSVKHALAALWQRMAAVLLAGGSNALSVTAVRWTKHLHDLGVAKRADVIPVGSNIPQVVMSREERLRLRSELLGERGGLLIAGFGALQDRDVSSTLYGIRELNKVRRARLVWIGGDKSNGQAGTQVGGSEVDNVVWAGYMAHANVSKLLGACDLMVLPFIDGVSTRRTSAVTAIQHGLPLLTTAGKSTDSCFVHRENVYLVPVRDEQKLAQGLIHLAGDDELRSRLSHGARLLFEKQFAWDVIARKVISLVELNSGPLSTIVRDT